MKLIIQKKVHHVHFLLTNLYVYINISKCRLQSNESQERQTLVMIRNINSSRHNKNILVSIWSYQCSPVWPFNQVCIVSNLHFPGDIGFGTFLIFLFAISTAFFNSLFFLGLSFCLTFISLSFFLERERETES